MENPVYKMMIANASNYLKTSDPNNVDTINAFELSSSIAICLCKLKEDVLNDIVTHNEDIATRPKV